MPTRQTLSSLLPAGEFQGRHIGPRPADKAAMLKELGQPSLAALIDNAVPAAIRTTRPLALPPALSEQEALAALRDIAAQNERRVSMIGMGYYDTFTPPVILRNLFENPGWYTAYTPYQAEVSQGRLEALLNWQQMVADLTGMALANASLLDEGTAAAEAMTMIRRQAKAKSDVFVVDADTHPQTLAVLRTRARPLGIEIVTAAASDIGRMRCFGALLSYPGSSGALVDPTPAIEALHKEGALVAVASDLLALTLLTPPGELGADIVLGSAQRFGVPMGAGGPHAAFFAVRDAYKRAMPGRLIGVSVDAQGKPALRMALQTREQHIRREKATSNICTAQVLLAVIAGMYAVWHGPEGLKRIASRVNRLTGALAAGLVQSGLKLENDTFFDTLTVLAPGRAAGLVADAEAKGFNLRPVDADRFGISLDETTTPAQLQGLLSALGLADADTRILDAKAPEGIPPALQRTSTYLEHPVFHGCRSETELMRYLRRLQGKDIALDRSMIPLGSCTMKLNAAAEMMPVSDPGFAAIHPFAPKEQQKGYRRLYDDLEAWLAEITGFAAVSLQPNAGSQGEYAGLLVIRAWHESRGEAHRRICLIPASAHGTNPASAVMAGMEVVVVDCDAAGNVDLVDLEAKLARHGPALAALMITYPSTHGVFEARIKEICELVHAAGGQVYMDGANLNALVGLARPGEIGADVSHMNLHKTFCIPHGGGGPGMGPIGVAAHLAPFLPTHPVVAGVNPAAKSEVGTVSAAPFGSASILPITWAYIAMMGAEGLTEATRVAILNANYVAARLAPHYPIVYKGQGGLVAHECIIDLRQLKQSAGITAEDVAKRLVDYGFHAPTMSWPVPDTMMVEPTESEDRSELERFIAAMIQIRAEIRAIEEGRVDRANNLLKHAPHRADLLLGSWERPYSKEEAFFPLPFVGIDKYWPPVARVDNAYGDRNLACSCPPVADYADAAD
ncbi:glycine dehydrogenase (decarboxylating) alpha subunit /glycine dehydrogenase (decarboxylating) beta subunit [Arboricoccus pini]|uniref:Glycine dehydrogenase (decarboxylating) n=1 Tax=Arboricoccus pini TaxID=1963835 RepID=A0A212S1W3_9PROT|nr:aminomethyl-transferring glycine dehydrogenase [Arboricoccus pini]SNB79127.1 glycine dehydrogenase (decarboxylating) alpha subunit /glycine dehydrogenase (decarboxylating) beta subunit [Arboricoccus pini]